MHICAESRLVGVRTKQLRNLFTLAESFNTLADEVQSLIDRKTILEHKLRYAHEQYQYLADKYAPGVPEVSEILAKLQLPPDLHVTPASNLAVPLPKRGATGDTRHQIALLIREGRKASQQLASAMADASKGSGSSKKTSSLPPGVNPDTLTSLSTVLELDFTVEGKKGALACPFSQPKEEREQPEDGDQSVDHADLTGTTADPTPHQSKDPICAAMLNEAVPAAAAKCPIRYLDKHSPEEIARYVETHKHEIPRSHEVCVSRYQKNEAQIRKLDAKYGNLVSMIKDLSQLHQPMLPIPADEAQEEVDKSSNRRVETWAQTVTNSDPEEPVEAPEEDDRQSHFDRPLRDVRVGESPSRPWGISVPLYHSADPQDTERPASPPPAPVQMPSPLQSPSPPPKATGGKCPFDHTKLGAFMSPSPFRHIEERSPATLGLDAEEERPATPVKHRLPPPTDPRPTFINTPELPVAPKAGKEGGSSGAPVTINFNGPVFIGYPMDQALQFLQQFQQGQGQK
ncbi:hypothetical protein GQ53DRAFT_794563 [Thozetella sp. PMI_491]|nr:hypothetical protein GQ53DRAFT_794563 [Thozetella sp. PMI_491]